MTAQPEVKGFFDEETFTISYVVADPATKACAIIDSVLDFDQASGRTGTGSADKLISYVRDRGFECEWIIDTHVHADHLTAAPYIKRALGGRTAIGDQVPVVQATFSKVFNEGAAFRTDGAQFDHLFHDGETYAIGDVQARAIHTPGHTPACMCHLIGDAAFVGDTIFMPDFGTARCDFPGGDAGRLFDSIHKLFELPDETRVFLCHDYKAPGRDEYVWETTIRAEKAENIHIKTGTSRDAFTAMRRARDATLAMPKLILPSVQVNMRAGEMPPPEGNGLSYLKLPIDAL
ncbi:MAG: MBL fold metallo-hydrolase [Alphaproteobacteria bacterium]|nr:MBL fold metallo-hydrolase [Alphaproteobacteria bacterium]